MRTIVKFAIAAILFAGPALAEDPIRQITVVGAGRIMVTPDIAWVDIDVSHQAETPEQAVEMIALAMTAVMEKLAEVDVGQTDIETDQITLGAVYEGEVDGVYRDYAGGELPTLLGYSASAGIDVRLRDLDRIGAVINAVVADGATTISGIRFDLSDTTDAYVAARRKAVADGRAKAELYADAAGVTLGRLISLREENAYGESPIVIEQPVIAADNAIAALIPVSPGDVGFSASVVMVYEITD